MKLHDYISKYGRRFDYAVQDDPLQAIVFEWLAVAGEIKRIFDFGKGPLASLIRNTDDWLIETKVMAGTIEARISLEMSSDVSISKTEEMLGNLNFFHPLKVEVDGSAFPKIKLALSARLQRAPAPARFPQLAAFFEFHNEMQAHFMESGCSDRHFFENAGRLFPSLEDDIFLATPAEWSRVLCQRYDQQFARTLLWLTESSRGPSPVLHNLKGQLQGCIETADRSNDFLDQVKVLRESARQAFSQLVRFTFGHANESRPLCDVVGIARQLINERRHQAAKGIEIVEYYADEPLVAVHHEPMRLILSNLLDNAVFAANRVGAGVIRVIVRQIMNDSSDADALIVISNPYDPSLPEDQASSGIGRKTARDLTKDNHGRCSSDRDRAAQKWTERIWLPVAV